MKQLVVLIAIMSISMLALQSCENNAVPSDSCGVKTYGAPAPAAAPLRAEGGRFRDASGGVVILRGVNMAGNSKVPPFTPITDASLLDPLPGWGFNVIRLLFTWEAYEGTRCAYDESYLAYYERIVGWARERGIYVIVDFHQDAYSRFSIDGCGEGFPRWAVTKAVELKDPDNGEACASWGTKMILDLSHHATWEDFHRDTYGARAAYLDMVESVADRMSKHANVIGYELINEPWGSDAQLAALFGKIAAKIRGRHPNAILFVPPHALVSGGMSANNIAKPSFANFAYSPHYYDGSVLLLKAWLGNSPAAALNRLRKKASSWQCPMILSEFGAPARAVNVKGYMEAQFDWLDAFWISGTQWDYTPGWRDDLKDGWNMEDLSITDGSGNARDNFEARPYPQRIAGTPGQFARSDAGFTLTWTNDPAAGSTVVYLPAGYGESGSASLAVPSGSTGSCVNEEFSLRCSVSGAGGVQLTFAH